MLANLPRRARRLLSAARRPPVVVNDRRYRIVAELATFGDGRLFVALDPAWRRVVLKRPGRDLDVEGAALFADEHRALVALRHPHVVRVVDFGVDARSGGHVLVTEYVRGARLGDAVQRARERDVARYLLQSLRVCDHLARRRVAHCDLKPDNILVAADGSIRIVDFGVATPHGEPIKGLSPAFVAPEHLFAAEAAPAGAATDLYALGVSFYWLLTGDHPYFDVEAPLYSQRARLTRAPAPPTALNPTIDPRWDACLLDLVDLDPERRATAALRVLTRPDAALPVLP